MEESLITGPSFKKINEPSDTMKDHYRKLYMRNQDKFIRRSKLECSHIDSNFDLDGRTYKLIGSVDSNRMVITDESDNSYYFVNSDIPTSSILKK
jgi:hypothetical protein